jgi:hypothetical protein
MQFGLYPVGLSSDGLSITHIRGQDIVDLIDKLTEKYGGNGKVGVRNSMACDHNFGAEIEVTWSIYSVMYSEGSGILGG